MALSKLALNRDPNAPVGQPAAMHFDCPCGETVPANDSVNPCACGAEYDARGYVITASVASKTEVAERYAGS